MPLPALPVALGAGGALVSVLVGVAATLYRRARIRKIGEIGLTAAAVVTHVEIAASASTHVRMPLLFNGISRDHSVWLSSGGRGIDTAFLYGDEQQRDVGLAIQESHVPRDELFVITKINCCPTDRCSSFCAKPPFHTDALHAVRNGSAMLAHSLALLNLRYADLVLLHFPCSDFNQTLRMYRALEAAHDQGRARAIGVSNFNASALQMLLAHARIRPALNQNAFSVAGHPPSHRGEAAPCLEGAPLYGSDDATLAYCRGEGIAFAAYSPLGHISKVGVLDHPTVRKIAAKHAREPAQIALRWLTQQGIAAVTATSRSDHAHQAIESLTFNLTKREMRQLARAM